MCLFSKAQLRDYHFMLTKEFFLPECFNHCRNINRFLMYIIMNTPD
jgi:hypothetical protein